MSFFFERVDMYMYLKTGLCEWVGKCLTLNCVGGWEGAERLYSSFI